MALDPARYETEVVSGHQHQEQGNGQAHPNGKRASHALATVSLGNHVVKRGTKAAKYGNEEHDDNDAHANPEVEYGNGKTIAATIVTGISFGRYRFSPQPVPTIATIVFVALTVSLGNWQTRRADEKMALQQRLDALALAPAVAVPVVGVPADTLVDHRISAHGEFIPEKTLFIDNRTYRGAPGYYVVTPLRIENSRMHVLVNRGWVAAGLSRDRLPKMETPEGFLTIEGIATVPQGKPYQLAADATSGPVRQHLVPQRIAAETRLAVQPIVLLQTSAAADGLVRDWPKPDAGVNTHLAYALQWYVMAVVIAAMWIGLNIGRVKQEADAT